MTPPAKLDPAALVPGQRVRLYAEDCEREGIPQDRVWIVQVGCTNSRVYFWTRAKKNLLIELARWKDGTLRDDEGRIVEVRDAE